MLDVTKCVLMFVAAAFTGKRKEQRTVDKVLVLKGEKDI
jgi:hypothetical protein